ERNFAANWLCQEVESLERYIGVAVVGRPCRLAHDGSDLSRRHAQMEPACTDCDEIHAWPQWRHALPRCCEIRLPSHGHGDAIARSNNRCCNNGETVSHFQLLLLPDQLRSGLRSELRVQAALSW